MIKEIKGWIKNGDLHAAHRVLWLHGPAGSGKSAVAHTICELQQGSGGAASFFFLRGSTDRGNALKLFTTLSYQLALHIPSLRAAINETLRRDPSLPTKSMETQLLALIIQPLLSCQPLPLHLPTIIIDGLDECADGEDLDTQRNIVATIAKSVVQYSNIPFRFMISSRPECWIRDAFDAAPLPNITLKVSLRDDLDVDKDIKAYLSDGFEKIRLENQRVMSSVPTPWPTPDVIQRFVYEASGQYIYASTILKFVGKHSRFSDPREQLRIITTPGPHRALAFSELDRLYVTILSAFPRWETMKRVLGGLLINAKFTTFFALKVDRADLALVLDALSSVIDIEQPRKLSEHEILLEPIFGSLPVANCASFCHLSFREFLEDEARSGPFHVDAHGIPDELTEAFFHIIHRNIDEGYKTEPYLTL